MAIKLLFTQQAVEFGFYLWQSPNENTTVPLYRRHKEQNRYSKETVMKDVREYKKGNENYGI